MRNLTTLPLLVTVFVREFGGKRVTLLKRVLYKTDIFQWKSDSGDLEGKSACKIEAMCFLSSLHR